MTNESEIVCLHGLGRSPRDWDGVRQGLAEFGPTKTPDLPRRPTDALRIAAAQVEPGAVLVGHSMGGVLALRLAAARHDISALVLTGCFFPPARDGRGLVESLRDYGAHRIAYVRSLRGAREGPRAPREGGLGAIGGLLALGARPGRFDRTASSVGCPVLVVHAENDHHVPIAFAHAGANRHGWRFERLDSGGHSVHVSQPQVWLRVVAPWLRGPVAG